jgi:hypothetical protein
MQSKTPQKTVGTWTSIKDTMYVIQRGGFHS